MSRIFALLLLASPAFAFDKPQAYAPHAAPKVAPVNADVYDLVLLDKVRPYWVRFHVRFDGKPYPELWARALDALFADLDRNGDGFLDAAECKRVPHRRNLIQVMETGYPYSAGHWPSPGFDELDTDRDGKVTRAELEAYYVRANAPLVRTVPAVNPDVYAETITRELFNLLDTNKDGKITPAEARAAEAWLDKFDLDDDECLSVTELVPNLINPQRNQIRATNATVPQMIFTRIDVPAANLAQQFLDRYDTDKDFHLSPTEIGLDLEAFAALDRDGNGKLDVPELADFFAHGLPDLEIRVAIGPNGIAATPEKIIAKRRPAAIRAGGVSQIVVKFGLFEVTLGAPTAATVVGPDAIRTSFRQSFAQQFAAVAGGKNYVDAADLQKPIGRPLLPFLVPADRDGDGKMTLKELNGHIDLLFRFADAPLGLTTFTTAPNWFAELDTNHDGRLSRMELRNAWKSLTARQPRATELPFPTTGWALRPVLHRGPQAPFNPVQNYFNPTPTAAPTRGPLWFRKMDRNGDGYVSRREFLGTRAEFDRIDRNGDGLIDPDEAEAAGK